MDNVENTTLISEETCTIDNLDAIVDSITNQVEEDRKTIPVNSESLLVSENTIRFQDADWFSEIQKHTITLAGLGGIGSYVAVLVSRLKPNNILLYDGDYVDKTNLAGQLYGTDDIGESKTSATAQNMHNYSDYFDISAFGRFIQSSIISPIAICGFDNMEARKLYFQKWWDNITSLNINNSLFIDGRLAAEEFQVFCMTGNDTYLLDKYRREWLFNDDKAEETLCSYKQTSFCANMIASVMVNLLVNFITNKCNPLIERPLPFMTRYDATTMNFQTEL